MTTRSNTLVRPGGLLRWALCLAALVSLLPLRAADDATARQVAGELEARFPALHMVGRNGMHRYNNQDHAMMTAMLAVRNIVAGERVYDIWCVNEDA